MVPHWTPRGYHNLCMNFVTTCLRPSKANVAPLLSAPHCSIPPVPSAYSPPKAQPGIRTFSHSSFEYYCRILFINNKLCATIPHEPWPWLSCLPSDARGWKTAAKPLTQSPPEQLLHSRRQLSACWPRPHTDGKEVTSSHFFPSFSASDSHFRAARAHLRHENAKSSPLFSTAYALFCN